MAAALAHTSVHTEPVLFAGGLDIVTPPMEMSAGSCRRSQNYECDVNGGYVRVTGYERTDGRPKPSDAAYAIVTCTISGSFASGNTVTGATSGATGVCIDSTSSSVILTKVTGTFVSGENLQVAAVTQAVSTAGAITDGASTPLLHAQYKDLAAAKYRSDIAAPTGSGSSLGGLRFNGVTYTFRNNAGGTAASIWKSSASGWQAVTLYNEVSFTAGGVTAPAEGATLTQGANTGTIKRVVLISGTWAGGTAAGRLIVTTPAPGNYAAGAATIGAINLNLSGAQSAITLLPNGRYKFIVKNFGGSTGTKRIYGCDGVNRGFEFDGDVFVPINTGMAADAPNFLWEHRNYLFFAFGASVQFSSVGTPYIWSVILGAGEFACGDNVTGIMTQPGNEATGALAIFTRSRTFILYGTSSSNFTLVPYRDELGAIAHSTQDVGFLMFLDNRGVTSLQTSQRFGNFQHATLSQRIRPWLNTQRTKVIDSCISRDKSQYRIFFSDGYALFVTIGQKGVVGMMPILFPNAATWAWSSEESDGTETILFGSSNGMVYQMEKGTSFDGAAIEHYLHLAFNFSKSPRINKHYRRAALEVTGTGYADFTASHELGYASLDIPQGTDKSVATSFSSVFWDAFTWDAFVWDGQTLLPAVVPLEGDAVNCSILIRGSSTYQQPIRFSGAIIHFTPRRIVRDVS